MRETLKPGSSPLSAGSPVEVGTPVARRPPHRSRRAVFPHRALQVNSLSHSPSGMPWAAESPSAAGRNLVPSGKAYLRYAFSVIARRKVRQSVSVFLTALVACADCVNLSPPSPASGLAPCGGVLWGDPTPGWPESASCRCAPLPAWPSQLVRQGPAGPPRFRAAPSARATLSDPDRPARTSPVSARSVLGSATVTSSPPVLRLSRLDCFSGMRVPPAARA